MDGPLIVRQQKLLERLAARTNRDGTAKPNYKENVAAIRAELSIIQERLNGQG